MQLKLKGLLVMQTVEIIVNILMVIVAVLLVIVVLAQNAKSAGLGSAFGNDTTALGQARNAKRAGKQSSRGLPLSSLPFSVCLLLFCSLSADVHALGFRAQRSEF